MYKVQYFSAEYNVNADNLVRQLTVVDGDTRLSSKTTNACRQSIIDTCTDSLDIHEITELKKGAVDQEQGGSMKIKSKAQKKLDQEKAKQRQ